MVVLVYGGTASAAEVVAGALQGHDRAPLMGESTFGKGSVQEIFGLSDGSSLHVTSAVWLTPDRQRIDEHGLTPDIVVSPGNCPGDEPVRQAVDYLESE
jgi:carboxyl-terminal processing protease